MNFETYIIDFLKYLKEDEGFLISEEVTSSIFVYISENNVNIEDENEVVSFLRPLLCKTSAQYNAFPEIFRNYIKLKLNIDEDILREKQNKERCQKSIDKAKEELENLKAKNERKRIEQNKNCSIFDGYKKRKSFLVNANKNKKYLKKILTMQGMTSEEKSLLNYLFFDEDCEDYPAKLTQKIIDNLKKHINEFAFKSAMQGNKEIINLLKETSAIFADAEKKLLYKSQSEDVGKQQENEMQSKIDKLLRKLDGYDARITQKEKSLQHRNSFISRSGSVQCEGLGEALSSKELSSINAEEFKEIGYYIKKNARFFKTKMSRNIQTDSSVKFDIKNIVKQACATDGIPLRLAYKKRTQNKPKITLILDISGSCSSASRLMLLFMYYLKQVFTGGCSAYVFVDSLYNVTSFIDVKDPNVAIKGIMSTVRTKGVYSNYYEPLKTFYEDELSSINKDSIVMFIGDARNNNNPTGEKYLKAISRKAKACFWLNTEDKNEWNKADSIIDIYSPYMQQTLPILTVGQLINFITNFKLRKE